ncbi:glycosyltransferase [Lactobacillus reuteri]|nr:glycosyltransferase [Limosilactobacillus reuteri]
MKRLTLTCQILNFNNTNDTIRLVESIREYHLLDHILIVDNNSTDNSYSILKKKYSESNRIQVIKTNENRGYGAGNNYGIKFAFYNMNSDTVLLANPDVSFSENTISSLTDAMNLDDSVAITSAVQRKQMKIIKDRAWKIPTKFEYIFSDTKFSKWIDLSSRYSPNHYEKKYSQVDCVPGALLLINSKKFLEVGGYDENMFLYCEETTIGYKLKVANYKTILVNDAFYDHDQSSSIRKSIPKISKQRTYIYENRLLFLKKYLKSSWLTLWIAKSVYSYILKKLELKGNEA